VPLSQKSRGHGEAKWESVPSRAPNHGVQAPAFGVVDTEMKNDKPIIPSGPFKGKRIEFAPTTGVERLQNIAEDFMQRIFGFEPGAYLITDVSSLFDFTGVDDMDLRHVQQKIQEVYNLDVTDITSGNLLTIFVRIQRT
jgi:hypothetical protein